MSEQNKTNLHNDLLHEKDDESFELPDINMAFNAADTEESIPSTSAAVANAPPFTISSCLRPVGRAKGGAQSSVSFHKKVTFKRVASTREFAKSSQPAKICKTSKPTKSTTTTKTKNTKKTIIETSESTTTTTTQYEGDDATEDDLSTESFGSIISKTNK